MFILHVTYHLKPGMRDEYLAKLKDLGAAEKSRQDKGCIQYEYFLPEEDENRILLVERWESPEDQAAHIKTEHVRALAAIKNDYVENTESVKYLAEEYQA